VHIGPHAREADEAADLLLLELLDELEPHPAAHSLLQRPRHAVEIKVGAEERREPGEVGGEERANGDGVAGVVLRA
jgi:hypothetical protein